MPRFDWQDARRATITADGEMLREVIWLDTDSCELAQYVLAPVGEPFILSFNAKGELESQVRKFRSCTVSETPSEIVITLEGLDDDNRPGT